MNNRRDRIEETYVRNMLKFLELLDKGLDMCYAHVNKRKKEKK